MGFYNRNALILSLVKDKSFYRFYSDAEFYGGCREFSGQIQVLCLDSCLPSLYLDAARILDGQPFVRPVVKKN